LTLFPIDGILNDRWLESKDRKELLDLHASEKEPMEVLKEQKRIEKAKWASQLHHLSLLPVHPWYSQLQKRWPLLGLNLWGQRKV